MSFLSIRRLNFSKSKDFHERSSLTVSDLHSINEAINKRAGRKLLPSIGVSIFLIFLVWASLATYRVFFAALVAIAVLLGIRELNRALSAASIHLPLWALAGAGIGLSAATWIGGVSGLAVATAIAFPCLLVLQLPRGTENFVKTVTSPAIAPSHQSDCMM